MAITILWVYIVFLIVGGLMGFIKAGSKVSLITSVIFAIALALFAAGVIRWAPGADVLLGLLLLVGWQARWAALGMAIFLAVITPIYHNYWAAPEAQQRAQKQNFDKTKKFMPAGLMIVVTAVTLALRFFLRSSV